MDEIRLLSHALWLGLFFLVQLNALGASSLKKCDNGVAFRYVRQGSEALASREQVNKPILGHKILLKIIYTFFFPFSNTFLEVRNNTM